MCQVVTLTSTPPAPGAECVTAGWGTHTTSGLFMTNILQRLSATIVDKEECNTVSIQFYIYIAQAQGHIEVQTWDGLWVPNSRYLTNLTSRLSYLVGDDIDDDIDITEVC